MIRKGTRVRIKNDVDVSVVGKTGTVTGKSFNYDWKVMLDHGATWSFDTHELEREDGKESKPIIRKGTRVKVVANLYRDGQADNFIGSTGTVHVANYGRKRMFLVDIDGDEFSPRCFLREELEREDDSK